MQFLTKYSYYRETLGIFQQKPTGHDENLLSIVTFMAQVHAAFCLMSLSVSSFSATKCVFSQVSYTFVMLLILVYFRSLFICSVVYSFLILSFLNVACEMHCLFLILFIFD